MTLPAIALLGPAAAAPPATLRQATGRSPAADDGARGFAGALAAAADKRQADAPADSDAADAPRPQRDDDKQADSATAMPSGDVAAAALPTAMPVTPPSEARQDDATPADEAAALEERMAAVLRGLQGLPGDGRLPSAGSPAGAGGDAAAAAAASQDAAPAPGDARQAAAAAGVASFAASLASASAEVEGGAVVLPADIDTVGGDARRGTRGRAAVGPGGAAASVSRNAAADAKATDPSAALATPQARPGDLAAAGTQALQAGRVAEAVTDKAGPGAATGTDNRVPGGAFAQALAGAGPALPQPAAADALPRFEARLQAALGSPEFVPSLGAQVSTLVRNGIPEARLHLHPAELGPITVQIEIDGQRAQVNMAVEHAATRQVLEQAIPTLASALRDNGLTLTGGGVFQQPREPRGQADAPDAATGRRARGDDESDSVAALAAAPPRARQQRGALDLYA